MIASHWQRVARRAANPKQRKRSISGHILNNTISLNENTNHAASREVDSVVVLRPVNGYTKGVPR